MDAVKISPVRPTLWHEIKRQRNAYFFIAPFFTVFLLFMVFPIGYSAALSLTRWNGIVEAQFVGLDHYRRAMADENFHRALLNTLIFSALTVTISVVVGLTLALFLNSVRFFQRFFRSVFFIPSVVSLVVVALLWKMILNSEVGMFNEAVRGFGVFMAWIGFKTPEWTHHQYRFLDSSRHFVPLLTMTLVNVWGVVGFNTVIFLAGLQGIPSTMYEVAHMDGATWKQDLRYVTLPMLRPTMFFVVLITTIDSLQVFVLPNVMNRGAASTMTVVYYLFQNAFEFYRMGYASAIAYVLFALTLIFSIIIRLVMGRRGRAEDFL